MLIAANGDSVGGVSAGCIEEEVIACAREVLHSRLARLIAFDTRARFGCHGTIKILVEPVRPDVMNELSECIAQRQPCCIETTFTGEACGTRIANFEPNPAAFVQVIEPLLRLILIGQSAESPTLLAQAALLGWDVVRVDSTAIPAELLLDHRAAVVVATHNFGRDAVLLRQLLPAGLKYLGLVGSRRRRDDLLFDLLQQGIEVRSELFAPAGLHLGADGPEAIALSIVAEIQSVFASATAQSLRHHKGPIHAPLQQPPACQESAV